MALTAEAVANPTADPARQAYQILRFGFTERPFFLDWTSS